MRSTITHKDTRIAGNLAGSFSVFHHALEVVRYDQKTRLCFVKARADNACVDRINKVLFAARLPQRIQLKGMNSGNTPWVDLEVGTPTGTKVVKSALFPEWNASGATADLVFAAAPLLLLHDADRKAPPRLSAGVFGTLLVAAALVAA